MKPEMELRDYFATKAMQALIGITQKSSMTTDRDRKIIHKNISQASYELADAMIEEIKLGKL